MANTVATRKPPGFSEIARWQFSRAWFSYILCGQNQGKFRTLKQYWPYRYIPAQPNIGHILRYTSRIILEVCAGRKHGFSILAIVFLACAAPLGVAGAQGTPPATDPALSRVDMVKKAREALDRNDYALALALFRKAAEQGSSAAQMTIGWID